MSFQDPPRRQRQPRYPALAQYEDGYASYQDTQADYSGNGYQDGYQEFAGLAGTPEQRAPWDDPQQYGFRGPNTGSQSTPNSGKTSVRDSGAQGSIGIPPRSAPCGTAALSRPRGPTPRR